MKGQEVLFSHKNTGWETPTEFYKQLDQEFNFTLDAAASKENTKCIRYFTEEEDALKQSWHGEVIFCNPAYSLWQKFVAKAFEEWDEETTIVMLLPSRTDTKAFHRYIWDSILNEFISGVEVRFISGRLHFEMNKKPILGKNGKPSPAGFPSLLLILRKDKFKEYGGNFNT